MTTETTTNSDTAPVAKTATPEPAPTPSVDVNQYNNAIRRVKALETIAKSHNIDLSSMTSERLNAIPVNDGVAGEFVYTAPKITAPAKPPARVASETKSGLTLEEVKSMSESQINARWKEVSELLANNPNASGAIT